MKLAMYDGLSQMGAKLGATAPRHLSNDQYKYLSLTYDAASLTDHIDHEFEGRQFMVLANWETGFDQDVWSKLPDTAPCRSTGSNAYIAQLNRHKNRHGVRL